MAGDWLTGGDKVETSFPGRVFQEGDSVAVLVQFPLPTAPAVSGSLKRVLFLGDFLDGSPAEEIDHQISWRLTKTLNLAERVLVEEDAKLLYIEQRRGLERTMGGKEEDGAGHDGEAQEDGAAPAESDQTAVLHEDRIFEAPRRQFRRSRHYAEDEAGSSRGVRDEASGRPSSRTPRDDPDAGGTNKRERVVHRIGSRPLARTVSSSSSASSGGGLGTSGAREREVVRGAAPASTSRPRIGSYGGREATPSASYVRGGQVHAPRPKQRLGPLVGEPQRSRSRTHSTLRTALAGAERRGSGRRPSGGAEMEEDIIVGASRAAQQETKEVLLETMRMPPKPASTTEISQSEDEMLEEIGGSFLAETAPARALCSPGAVAFAEQECTTVVVLASSTPESRTGPGGTTGGADGAANRQLSAERRKDEERRSASVAFDAQRAAAARRESAQETAAKIQKLLRVEEEKKKGEEDRKKQKMAEVKEQMQKVGNIFGLLCRGRSSRSGLDVATKSSKTRFPPFSPCFCRSEGGGETRTFCIASAILLLRPRPLISLLQFVPQLLRRKEEEKRASTLDVAPPSDPPAPNVNPYGDGASSGASDDELLRVFERVESKFLSRKSDPLTCYLHDTPEKSDADLKKTISGLRKRGSAGEMMLALAGSADGGGGAEDPRISSSKRSLGSSTGAGTKSRTKQGQHNHAAPLMFYAGEAGKTTADEADCPVFAAPSVHRGGAADDATVKRDLFYKQGTGSGGFTSSANEGAPGARNRALSREEMLGVSERQRQRAMERIAARAAQESSSDEDEEDDQHERYSYPKSFPSTVIVRDL